MNTALNQHVLVLNRLWQAVNVCTTRRALTLLFQGHAQAVLSDSDGAFRTFNFEEWRDLSEAAPREESIHTISFRIRVPRIILLLIYDRLPRRKSSSRATTSSSATKTPASTAGAPSTARI